MSTNEFVPGTPPATSIEPASPSSGTPARTIEPTSPPSVAIPTSGLEPQESVPRNEPKSGLKGFTDNHPLPVALGIAITVAATVASVMQYFQSQTVARLNAEKSAAVISATTPLQESLDTLARSNDELTLAMASFRRTAGPNPDVFDIRTLLLDRPNARTLSSAFKYYEPHDVYVATPSSKAWKFEETSEAALAGLMQPDALPLLQKMLGASSPLFKKNLLVWRDTEPIVVTVERDIDETTATLLGIERTAKMNLFAFTAIQRADRKLIQEMFKTFHFEQANDTDALKSGTSDDPDEAKMLIKLGDMFSADIAGSMLIGQSNALMMVTQVSKDVTFKITNVEKKGPVLYLSAAIDFHNARVKGQTGRKNVTWNRELMVTSIGDVAYVIATSVPTVSDGRSAAFGWVSQWLQSVRIPCECPQVSKGSPSQRNT